MTSKSPQTHTTINAGFSLPFLTAGLILLLAGSHWFPGAGTVGLILTIIGGIPLAVALLVLIVVVLIAILD